MLANRGTLFVSSLVTGRWFGDRYLGLLHRTREVSKPRSASEFAAALESEIRISIEFQSTGNFAYAREEHTP